MRSSLTASKSPDKQRWAGRVLAARGGTFGQQYTTRLEMTMIQVLGAGKE